MRTTITLAKPCYSRIDAETVSPWFWPGMIISADDDNGLRKLYRVVEYQLPVTLVVELLAAEGDALP